MIYKKQENAKKRFFAMYAAKYKKEERMARVSEIKRSLIDKYRYYREGKKYDRGVRKWEKKNNMEWIDPKDWRKEQKERRGVIHAGVNRRKRNFNKFKRGIGDFIFERYSNRRNYKSSGRSYKKRFSRNNFNSLVQTLGNNYINKGEKLTITGNRVKTRRRRRARY